MIQCKKCLLRDLPEEKIYESIMDYISSLDDDIKTTSAEYEKRLAICKACSDLISGTCMLCGCFVEARAAKAGQYCPNIDRKW